MTRNIQTELQEMFYGEPEKAVPWLAVGFGLCVGFRSRSLGWGLLTAGLLGKAWDYASPRLVIDDPRLGEVTLRSPRRTQAGGKQVWLTFDDGPGPHTQAVLKVLEEFGASATFFFIASQIPEGDALKSLRGQLESGGHRVGNHSWSHPNFLRLKTPEVRDEVERSDSALRKAFGDLVLPIFRPPFGYRSPLLVEELRRAGLAMVGWSVNSLDFLAGHPGRIVKRVLRLTDPGSVLLFHDGPNDRARTLCALPPILRDLSSKGYAFVTPVQDFGT